MKKDKIEEKSKKRGKNPYTQMIRDLNQAKKQASLGCLGKAIEHIELAKATIRIILGI